MLNGHAHIPHNHTPSPMSVVIIDSNEETRRRWRLALAAAEGIVVAGEAARVAEGISLVRDIQPQLIIVDPKIQDWNGLTVLRALKQWSPSSMILVVTTSATAEPASAFLEAGATQFLDKDREFQQATEIVAALPQRLTIRSAQ